MNLDTYGSPNELYLVRGDEVNPNRPIFTGDVFSDVPIPGVDDGGMAIVIAHPCSFRFGAGQLADRLLAARIRSISNQGPKAWRTGFLNRMPLPDLAGPGYWVAHLDDIGRCSVADLQSSARIACLSAFGVNMLQQRLTCHLTRAEIPTATFEQAFSHTFEEAELLEEWTDTLADAGWNVEAAAAEFERFIRSGETTWQERLKDPQMRPSVRRACRSAARRLAEASPQHL